MVTKTQEQILKLLLARPEELLSIRQIARILSKSYSLTHSNIQNLIKKNIVKTEKVPPAQIVRFSEKAPTSLLINIEMKRTEDLLARHSWLRLYVMDVLNTIEKPFFVMLVFGSYAKGIVTKTSDLDILIIAPAREDIAMIENASNQYTKIKKGIVLVDVHDFLEMIKNPRALNVGNEARKYHMILYGAETYFELLRQT